MSAALPPSRGLYAERVHPCGCRGVPEGQHLGGCSSAAAVREAPCCRICGYRVAPAAGHCPTCGAELAEVQGAHVNVRGGEDPEPRVA